MIKILIKTSDGRFNKFFKHSEFACNCTNVDCTRTLYNEELINILFIIRRNCKFPLDISSGYRCQKHNSANNGVNHSYHLVGMAADIRTDLLDDEQISILLKHIRIYSDYYYVGNGFIHLDKRNLL